MNYASVEPWQLLSFFEVEPTLTDPDYWPYTDAKYEVEQGGVRLFFAFNPAGCDVRLVLERNGTRLYRFTAERAEDIRYKKDVRVESLEIVISPKESVTLRVKPHIDIDHRRDAP